LPIAAISGDKFFLGKGSGGGRGGDWERGKNLHP
jgi:hypothetical protein